MAQPEDSTMEMPEEAAHQLSEQGWCLLPDVLSAEETAEVRRRLVAAAEASEARGVTTTYIGLDPNALNVRVFNLLDLAPVFRELIQHPLAVALVRFLLGEHFLISNFTANIALPGSGSMAMHSDQGIVTTPPWAAAEAINVIWVLDDMDEENGATRYVPGSHRWQSLADVPPDVRALSVPFEAPAGSILGMDGRLWHTSGANRSADRERALLFGFYCADHIRPQSNWNVQLSDEVQAGLSARMREWLGLDEGNVRYGSTLTALP
jgi:hypothetical protein